MSSGDVQGCLGLSKNGVPQGHGHRAAAACRRELQQACDDATVKFPAAIYPLYLAA